jgi:uncharacterized membrane protein (UPF0127 family)
MNIALCRLESPVTSRKNALERVAEIYRRAVAENASLVVFPEIKMAATLDAAGVSLELFLRPHDLNSLARVTGSIPMLIGGSMRPRQKVLEDRTTARVYALVKGKVQKLDDLYNTSQWLTVAGHQVETMIVGNSWSSEESWYQYHRRSSFLLSLGALVALDFHIQKCPQQKKLIPLHAYWHAIRSSYDPLSGNGIIRGSAEATNNAQANPCDALLIVNLNNLNVEEWNQAGGTPVSLADSSSESGDLLILEAKSPWANAVSTSVILGAAARIPLRVGKANLVAQIQRTWRQFRSGMMYLEQLADDEGMLFIFPYAQRVSFYMANTPSPLSCAYLDPDGFIVEIHDLEPFNRSSVRSNSTNIQYVLETRQGWFKDHGVSIGSSVCGIDEPLQKAFFGH